ncbi:hypothetical protein LWE61_16395 [Sphingobium sufflavum]|uniref:hypothetical protein n=1 Tax=Sphingobium sufflavum TaxID=1129547 RepID=UPI001F2BE3FC|nr:hypothetical protein [Sphingobium sufflavum]MCE7798124.1 hypothetical protein [Sphingobium sufflavum]
MHKEDNGQETHLSKTEARGGSRNKVNRTALVGGLVLVLIAFAVILGFGLFQTDRTGADEISADNTAVNESH